MILFVSLLCAAAAAYQALAIFACVAHLRRRKPLATQTPPVSILKPIYGADSEFYRAIHSHALIHYPEFEILFGVRTRSDTALPWIERLQRERPDLLLRIIDCTTVSPNGKVGSLIDLAREARHPVLLVNDSDIVVEPDYLRNIVAPLENPETGLVTCLYRASGSSFPAKMEALGIATDFAPSTLVAPVVGVNEFGLGSTLCFRASDLQRIGGFENIAPYIADDYQLGKRISQSGLKVHLSTIPVETHLGGGSWRDVWHHQVRWARTVRVSKGAGYSGLLITNATFWAVAAALAGLGGWAIGLIFLRLATGLLCGAGILRDPLTRRLWWLMPVRDLFGVAVWAAGLFGRTVIWRGKNMKLTSEGRLEEEVN